MPFTTSGKYEAPSDQVMSARITSHRGLTPTGIPLLST